MSAQTSPRTVTSVLIYDVRARVRNLQEGLLNRRGPVAQANAQADLAKLRGGDPADPTTHPECWSIVQGDTPPELLPKFEDDLSAAERARHCALVTYARHQQAQTSPMHATGVVFARAVRALGAQRATSGEDFDPNVRRRFDQSLLAPTWIGRSEHLNALVRLMRTESIAFDYGLLANDLRRLSHPEDARRVRVRWARELYSRPVITTEQSSTEEVSQTNEGELA